METREIDIYFKALERAEGLLKINNSTKITK